MCRFCAEIQCRLPDSKHHLVWTSWTIIHFLLIFISVQRGYIEEISKLGPHNHVCGSVKLFVLAHDDFSARGSRSSKSHSIVITWVHLKGPRYVISRIVVFFTHILWVAFFFFCTLARTLRLHLTAVDNGCIQDGHDRPIALCFFAWVVSPYVAKMPGQLCVNHHRKHM